MKNQKRKQRIHKPLSLSEKDQIRLGREISEQMGTPRMDFTQAGKILGISKQAAAKLEYKAFAKLTMALRQFELNPHTA